VHSLVFTTFNLCTETETSTFTHSKDMTKNIRPHHNKKEGPKIKK